LPPEAPGLNYELKQRFAAQIWTECGDFERFGDENTPVVIVEFHRSRRLPASQEPEIGVY